MLVSNLRIVRNESLDSDLAQQKYPQSEGHCKIVKASFSISIQGQSSLLSLKQKRVLCSKTKVIDDIPQVYVEDNAAVCGVRTFLAYLARQWQQVDVNESDIVAQLLFTVVPVGARGGGTFC